MPLRPPFHSIRERGGDLEAEKPVQNLRGRYSRFSVRVGTPAAGFAAAAALGDKESASHFLVPRLLYPVPSSAGSAVSPGN